MSDNAIVVTQPAPVVDPDSIKQIAQLLRSILPNGAKLSDQEIMAAAYYAAATGQNVAAGDFYVMPGRGISPGYRGELKRVAREGEDYYTNFRPPTPEEVEWHEIAPGDTCVICELYLIEQVRKLKELGMPYHPIIGLGVVRKDEKFSIGEWQSGRFVKFDTPKPISPPVGRSWHWKARIRALKDALRQIGYETPSTDEELADAEEHARVVAAEMRSLPVEEQVKRLEANTTAMRGPKDFKGFDDISSPQVSKDEIIARLRQRAAQMGDAPADDQILRILWGHLSALCDRDKAKELVGTIFGVSSSRELTVGQAKALIEWVSAKPAERDAEGKPTKWQPTGPAQTEYPIVVSRGPSLFNVEVYGEEESEQGEE